MQLIVKTNPRLRTLECQGTRGQEQEGDNGKRAQRKQHWVSLADKLLVPLDQTKAGLCQTSLCLLIQTFPRPEASKNTSIFLFKQYHVVFVSVFFSLLAKLKHI